MSLTPAEIEATVTAMRERLNAADAALPRVERFDWKQHEFFAVSLDGFDGQAKYDLTLQDDGR